MQLLTVAPDGTIKGCCDASILVRPTTAKDKDGNVYPETYLDVDRHAINARIAGIPVRDRDIDN